MRLKNIQNLTSTSYEEVKFYPERTRTLKFVCTPDPDRNQIQSLWNGIGTNAESVISNSAQLCGEHKQSGVSNLQFTKSVDVRT